MTVPRGIYPVGWTPERIANQHVLILERELLETAKELRAGKDPLVAASQLEYTLRLAKPPTEDSDA